MIKVVQVEHVQLDYAHFFAPSYVRPVPLVALNTLNPLDLNVILAGMLNVS